MIENILLMGVPGLYEWLVIMIICLICYGIPVFLIIYFIRFVIQTGKERRLMRLELGKLADELQQLKKELKSEHKDNNEL
jgi:hypothetical protein